VRKAAGVLFPSSDASKRAWRGHLGLPRRLTGGSCAPRRWSLRGHRSGMAPTGSGGSALEVIGDAAEARSGCGSSHSGARLGAGARQRRVRAYGGMGDSQACGSDAYRCVRRYSPTGRLRCERAGLLMQQRRSAVGSGCRGATRPGESARWCRAAAALCRGYLCSHSVWQCD
jgi:hypothetical protein